MFNWANAAELTSKVFSAGNLQLILTQFVYLGVVAGTGAWLTGKSVRNFALGFVAASLLFSFFLAPATTEAVKGRLKSA